MFCPRSAAIVNTHARRAFFNISLWSERENVLLRDHDYRRPTRRDSRGISERGFATSRLGATLECFPRSKMDFGDTIERRRALRTLQDLGGHYFGFSLEIRYCHRHMFLQIDFLKSRSEERRVGKECRSR